VAIPAAWSITDNWNDHPLSLLISVPQIKEIQIIGCQTAAACGTTINNHLQLINGATSMCGSGRWRNSGTFHNLGGNLNPYLQALST
jgi:hypothetical protein